MHAKQSAKKKEAEISNQAYFLERLWVYNRYSNYKEKRASPRPSKKSAHLSSLFGDTPRLHTHTMSASDGHSQTAHETDNEVSKIRKVTRETAQIRRVEELADNTAKWKVPPGAEKEFEELLQTAPPTDVSLILKKLLVVSGVKRFLTACIKHYMRYPHVQRLTLTDLIKEAGKDAQVLGWLVQLFEENGKLSLVARA